MLVFFALTLWLALTSHASAQISPPGLGDTNTAAWFAVGARQDLDADQRRQSMTYVGVGSVSHQGNDADPLRTPAIVVLNEEVSDRFARHWQYSLAVSYRRRHGTEGVEQELRSYTRFAHIAEQGRFKVTHTVRPELRTFLNTRFQPLDEALELRLRFRSQLSVALDRAREQHLIGSAELLAATTRARGLRRWTELGYRESRFCLYYALARERWPCTLHVGYMNDLIGRGSELRDVHYLALDISWNNPFGKP
jgi:hypothetical protein